MRWSVGRLSFISIGGVLVDSTTHVDSNSVQVLISNVKCLRGMNFVNMKIGHVPNR